MRVLHISSAKTIRGGEHQICLLIKELSLLGIESVLLCPSGSMLAQRYIKGLYKLVTYMKLSPANMFVSAFIKRLSVQEKIDVIHFHDPHSHQFGYYSYKLFANKVPGVVTRRVSFRVKNTSKPYYQIKELKKIICVSKSVKTSLSNLNISEPRLAIIPSGIELEKTKLESSIRRKFKIDSDVTLIANLAAIAPQKDFITFVNTASAYLSKQLSTVKFLIIGGDGGMMDQIKSMVKKQNLEDDILFAGFIPDAHQYLSEIDILLSTSVSEGLGNTIMEAMKYEVPIVATRCEGTIDLVKDNHSALLADIGDSSHLANLIERILADKSFAKKLTDNAKSSIEIYNIKKTSEQVCLLYKEVLNEI